MGEYEASLLNGVSPAESHAARYQGKNLLFLMLAIGAPAALLYLRLVFGHIATESRASRNGIQWLSWWSDIALALFFVAQLVCACYLQRLLKPRQSVPAIALQYLGVLLLCVLLSVTGAVLLEGFGYYFFLRVKHLRMPQ